MPNNFNSASRLLKILRRVASQSPNAPTLDVWASAFDIDTSEPGSQFRVAERIEALLIEIKAIRIGMAKKGFSDTLYDGPLGRVQGVLTLHMLVQGWGSSSPQLTEQLVLHPLAFCAEILPNEENEISSEEISELEKLLSEFELAETLADIPDALRDLIDRHVALIRDALRMYAITGASSLRKAVRAATGDLVEAQEVIVANKGKPAVAKFGHLWKRVDQISGGLIKAEKIGRIASDAAEWLTKLLP